MKRKALAIAIALLTMIAGGVSVQAQSVGEWRLYSLFADGVTKIIDAQNKVYYISSNRLFSYDKNTQESYSYTTDNVLNDTNVSDIYYNAEKNYVVVAYDTSNMDVILDDSDDIVNLSDISIANLTYTKTINDVAFGKDRMIVATDFGVVVYNDKTFTVTDSGIYGKSVKYATVSGDYFMIYYDYGYYYAKIGARINTFDKFTKLMGTSTSMLEGTDNGFFEYNSGSKYVRFYTVDFANGKGTCINNCTDMTSVKSVIRKKDNTGAIIADSKIYYVDFATGEVSENTETIPSELQSQQISFSSGVSSVWGADASGIANYDISDGNVTVKANKILPEALTCSEAAFIVASEDGSRIYVSNLGYTAYRSVGCAYDDAGASETRQRTDVIINGVPRAASLVTASANKPYAKRSQGLFGNKAAYSPDRLAVDPANADRYFLPTMTEGVYVVKYDSETGEYKEEGKLDGSNTPMRVWNSYTYGWVSSCYFDPKGNLWLGYRNGSSDAAKEYSPYLILPAEKVQGTLSDVTSSDWITTKHLGELATLGETRMVMCKKSGTIFTFDGAWTGPLGVYQTNGNYTDTSKHTFFNLDNLKDTDGSSFAPQHWCYGIEDKNGQAWFGTTAGVAVVPSPSEVQSASYQIKRPKVPREDGTSYADYLLDGEQVNAIAVDAMNCKWIGTENSGLYYVNEDGSKILANYTKDNSPLPSNTIQSLYCDPNSNLVYIGLNSGIITYSSTTISAATDYSEVYAYPNPVRPDYTGWITVTGLMENSLVKIADAAGNVVFQTTSNGGMAVWDGCNQSGERVSTGVYFVFASQNENDNASAVVTKIMIVK